MPRHHGSESVELQRTATRLLQLGVLRTFVADNDAAPRQYVSTTVAGDTVTVTPFAAAWYLRGLAHREYAEQRRAAVDGGAL